MTQPYNDSNTQPPSFVSNDQFLDAIFRVDKNQAHVTVFHDDPTNIITQEQRARAWAGGHWGNLAGYFTQGGNQYYTISTFSPAPDGRDRRRISLFKQCYVIVIDDVGQGLSAKVDPLDPRISPPSFALETSPDNCQYGYILNIPETDAGRIDNLLDGMVAAGIVEDLSDPGMKGVTRYVRLPEGTNNKSKYVEVLGAPFQCNLKVWQPQVTYTLDQLAQPFGIDLNAARESKEGITVADENHPGLVAYGAQFGVKSKLAGDRYDVTCPRVEEHSDLDDSGAAIWTYPDGRLGFKCHHSHGHDLSGNDIMTLLYKGDPELKMREVLYVSRFTASAAPLPPPLPPPVPGIDIDNDTQEPVPDVFVVNDAQRMVHCRNGGHALPLAENMGLYLELCQTAAQCQMPESITECINSIAAVFGINRKVDIRERVEEFMPDISRTVSPAIVQQYFYITTAHKFIHRVKGILIAPEALNQSWGVGGDDPAQHIFKDAGGFCLDGITWIPNAYQAPRQEVVQVGLLDMVNLYVAPPAVPDFAAGLDISPYLEHLRYLIPVREERIAFVEHMAYTMQHPEVKINWQIVYFGKPGTGKDTALVPMRWYMGSMYSDISPEDVDAGWHDSFVKKKVLVYQEVHRPQDKKFMNDLKGRAATTAGGSVMLNIKGKALVEQPNLFSLYMFSNHDDPVVIDDTDRRYFVIGDMSIEPKTDNKNEYYFKLYNWLEEQGGSMAVAHWLLNMDLSNFNKDIMPFHTEARRVMIDDTRSEVAEMIAEHSSLQLGVFGPNISCFTHSMVAKYLRDLGERFFNSAVVKRELKSLGFTRTQRLDKMLNGKRHQECLWVNGNYAGHKADNGVVVFDDLTDNQGRWAAYTRCHRLAQNRMFDVV